MRSWYLIGMGCGMLVGFILVFILPRYMKTDGSKKCKYDERQEIARGKGFKYGFFTMLIGNAVYGMLELVSGKTCAEPMFVMYAIMCAGIIAYIGYCIWNDAYMSLNENPKRVLGCFSAIAILNLLVAGYEIGKECLFVNGEVGVKGMNLLSGLLFLAVVCIMGAKKVCDRKETE